MTIETKATYQIIKADDGMVLTEWQNGDDILNYTYSAKQYSPLTYDITKLREITQEESDRLVKEQEEKIKEQNGNKSPNNPKAQNDLNNLMKAPTSIDMVTNMTENSQAKTKGKVVGRNEPCPCGSGKKYKNCCGRNAK